MQPMAQTNKETKNRHGDSMTGTGSLWWKLCNDLVWRHVLTYFQEMTQTVYISIDLLYWVMEYKYEKKEKLYLQAAMSTYLDREIVPKLSIHLSTIYCKIIWKKKKKSNLPLQDMEWQQYMVWKYITISIDQ